MSDEITNDLLKEYARLAALLSVVLVAALSMLYVLLLPDDPDGVVSPWLRLLLETIVDGISILATYTVSYFAFSGIRRIRHALDNKREQGSSPNTEESHSDAPTSVNHVTLARQALEDSRQAVYSVLINLIDKLPQDAISIEESSELQNQLRYLATIESINMSHSFDLSQKLVKKANVINRG